MEPAVAQESTVQEATIDCPIEVQEITKRRELPEQSVTEEEIPEPEVEPKVKETVQEAPVKLARQS